ncbi:MAG: hypothetical protein H7A36_06300 [Chlamydiales bacterium]|nr:hypothetical protein [Chlamydiales bacterium]
MEYCKCSNLTVADARCYQAQGLFFLGATAALVVFAALCASGTIAGHQNYKIAVICGVTALVAAVAAAILLTREPERS